ncbi:uncharacterized protein LOC108745145 isoform X2 [Agrilus planipennis]|uniref:Uncharacterized protein LOC108745145 isoform X2 n=1 Tax=Agrilus planipennis TaxID=224129 RepID=A0A1W4XL84_AGRPL|nr:uncharacterized protein LOC108745145 isoform X2 [Agrilus planipennis]
MRSSDNRCSSDSSLSMESESGTKPRRLSQIFDPLTRLHELTRETRSTPSSPRLLPRRKGSEQPKQQGPIVQPFAAYEMLDGSSGLHRHHYEPNQEPINWQERCLELQLELHRSRTQATRTRDMLREKVCG